jgi:thiol-disulfide isomerase/thioredoxin
LNWPQEKSVSTERTGCKEQTKLGIVKAELGKCAPNFTLKTIDGKAVELYKNNGKPTVVNFWASWCPPCKEEMPYFQAAYDKYKDRVNFLMVNETTLEEDEEVVALFLEENQYTFPVLYDRSQPNNKTVGLDQYGVLGVPMTYVVAPDGKITHYFRGSVTKQQMEKLMAELTD